MSFPEKLTQRARREFRDFIFLITQSYNWREVDYYLNKSLSNRTIFFVKNAAVLSSIYLLSIIPVFGAWTLIDDFQQWNEGEIFVDATDIGWHASSPAGTDEYWMLADPWDPSNIALFVETGGYGIGTKNVWIQKELPGGGIAPGETGTLFWRCLWSGFSNYWHIGTADKPLEFDDITGRQTTPGAWGDFNALVWLGDAQNIEHRDGDKYVSTNPPVVVDVNNWYYFFMIVENKWDMNTAPPTCTGVYTLYMQGPGIGDVPTLIPVGTDPGKDSAFIRRAPVDTEGNPQSIIWVMFATNSSSANNPPFRGPFLLDDFYFSPGMNLSLMGDPPEWYTCYQILNEQGDVDTGDLLDWINVAAAPYLWSYSLEGWIYMHEPSCDASGAWAYFYK